MVAKVHVVYEDGCIVRYVNGVPISFTKVSERSKNKAKQSKNDIARALERQQEVEEARGY